MNVQRMTTPYKEIQGQYIAPGTKVTVRHKTPLKVEERVAVVAENYKNHVLLDFGKYKECRRKADIIFGIGSEES